MGNIALRLDSANNGDLQQMDSAHEHYIAYQAGIFMASQDSNLVGNLGIIDTSDRNIGTLTDTYFQGAEGDHEFTGGNPTLITDTTTVYQKLGVNFEPDSAGSVRRIPIEFVDNSGTPEIHEMDSGEIDDLTLRIRDMLFGNQFPGVYKLGSQRPSANYSPQGDSASGSIFTDTRSTGANPVSIKYYLYQKDSDDANKPITGRPTYLKKANGFTGSFSGIQEMTDAQIGDTFGRRMGSVVMSETNGVGSYLIKSATQGAPSETGTWTAMGTATDTKQGTSNVDYSRNFARTRVSNYGTAFNRDFLGNYIGNFTGDYTRDFTGNYTRDFSDTYTRESTRDSLADRSSNYTSTSTRTRQSSYTTDYVGNYARDFTADYLGNASYAGDFTGDFTGNYARNYSANYLGNAAYAGNFTGDFTGNYARAYTRNRVVGYANADGIAYSRVVFLGYGTMNADYFGAGNFSRVFVGNYARAFTRNSTRTSTRTSNNADGTSYVGNYARAFTRNSTRVSTRTSNNADGTAYTGNYARNYSQTYTGDFTREFAGEYVGDYARNFTGNFAGEFLGEYVGNYSREYLRTRTSNYTRDSQRDSQRTRTSTYSENFTRNFEGNYTGEFAGTTIANTVGTVETYTLYLRTA